MTTNKGYDEQTRVFPPDRSEVYGQDGYGWYCTPETAARYFPRVKTAPTQNPLFVTLEGMTASKLRTRGFIL